MTDILFNLLQKNDLLWLDLVMRPSLSKEDDINIFKRYAARLSDPAKMAFYFGPLEDIGVSFKSGMMGLKVSAEKSIGSLLFIFYFKIQKKVVVNFMGEKIHLLPDEEIELINLRTYHVETLVNFFKGHDFKLVDEKHCNYVGQLMFAKK